MLSKEQVAEYVGSTDLAFCEQCLEQAGELVSAFVGNAVIPPVIENRAILETASELFARRNSPSGILQMATYDGTPVRLAKDPMSSSYPILSKYVVGF